MRKIATVPPPVIGETVRVMIYECEDGGGTYLFLYDKLHDGPCRSDSWYERRKDAEEFCTEQFGIAPDKWQRIDDPRPGCQHDWIVPTKVKRNENGLPLWGQFVPAED